MTKKEASEMNNIFRFRPVPCECSVHLIGDLASKETMCSVGAKVKNQSKLLTTRSIRKLREGGTT